MKAIPISRSEQSMAVDNEEQIDAVSFETSTDRGDYDLQVPRRAPKASGHADLVTIPALGYRETEMEKSGNKSSPRKRGEPTTHASVTVEHFPSA